MKYFLTFSFLLLSTVITTAQEIPMTFIYGHQDFEFLDAPISVNNGEVWDGYYSQAVDLGFTFEFVGKSFDRIEINSGNVDFYEVGSSRTRRIHALFRLLVDKGESESLSPISYQYEYSSEYEENIFKIEWKNAGVRDLGIPEFSTSSTDFINLQVWLHEESNNISIHFGPHLLDQETYLNNLNAISTLGIKLLVGEYFIGPIGNGDMPDYIIDECLPGDCLINIETYPSEGIFYCYSPLDIINATSELGSENLLGAKIHPNPTKGELNISVEEEIRQFTVQITDARGKLFYTDNSERPRTQAVINLQEFPKGLYLIKLQSAEQSTVKKVIKL